MTCLHCGAETTNGLALCERCRVAVLVSLEFLPVYFRNLARWKPSRAGGRPVPGSREPTDASRSAEDAVSRALDEAGTDLVGWAQCLADDRPEMRWPLDLADLDEAAQTARLCEIFAERITTISTLAWGGDFVASVRFHEPTLRYHAERAVPGWYAGACKRCGLATYVVPGLTWVTCGGCGSTTYARDRLDIVLNEAREWVARPMRIAEALVALIDTEMSVPRLHKRISKWGERDRITALRRVDMDGDEVGPKHYRLGEVLDVLMAEGATSLDTPMDAATEAS